MISKIRCAIGKIQIHWMLLLSYAAAELCAWSFLCGGDKKAESVFPLIFGLIWACLLTALLELFPRKIARVLYGISYYCAVIYVGFQTGYYILFSKMMWLTEFRYASEGADYASVLLNYPILWWIEIMALVLIGALVIWRYPKRTQSIPLVWGGYCDHMCYGPAVPAQGDIPAGCV